MAVAPEYVRAILAEAHSRINELEQIARLLYANAEGCAVNHYNLDFQQQGLPGWLADAWAVIDRRAPEDTSPEGT